MHTRYFATRTFCVLISLSLLISGISLSGEAPATGNAPAPAASADTGKAGADRATAAAGSQKKRKKERDMIADVFETFRRGGKIMYVLLFCSIIGFTFFLERLVNLRRSIHIPQQLEAEVLARVKNQDVEAGRKLLKDKAAALARVLDGILARKGAGRRELEQAMEDDAGRVLWDLRLNIRPVGIVATIAPLVGLLGTVFGMIDAFQEAAELGMDDPKNFASGIYVALYTTAFGLTIAIPFLTGYHYLRGKADVIMREVEDIAIRFVNEISG